MRVVVDRWTYPAKPRVGLRKLITWRHGFFFWLSRHRTIAVYWR